MAESSQLNDPNFVVQMAVGPPFADLVPQKPGQGLSLEGLYSETPTRLVFKGAHMSKEDFRIFNSQGHVVAAMWHFGKNPYEAFDPLGQSHFVQSQENYLGEWESVCNISGWQGMPHLRVRPKGMSAHGRQNVQDASGQRTLFNIGKESKIGSEGISIRSNLAVRRGDGKDVVYRILPDLMGRTLQVVDAQSGELVCFVYKSTKALLMNAALGAGSEMIIDVAPGVDWTAMAAIVLALQQVGKHVIKDAAGNWVVDPLKDAAVGGALEATGLSGVAGSLGSKMDQGLRFARKAQDVARLFK